MSWWGKLLGGTFGFMLGGPLGALLGASIGHSFDTGLKQAARPGLGTGSRERVQTAFFTATFSVMGHIAKADGRVSQDEIGLARAVMGQMQLTSDQQRAAMELFNQGKQADFPLQEIIEQFRQECHRRHTLMQMFLEIQLHAAYADGTFHPAEKQILQNITSRLGFTVSEFNHIEAMVRAQHAFDSAGSKGTAAKSSSELLGEAYAVLGVNQNSGNPEIKKAYRRLMNQHHPDKLVAKGLPPEMMKLATDKTHEIKSAYETVKSARGFK
jgi:DnaJ like chaperone protein